jgi:hypothetical protein
LSRFNCHWLQLTGSIAVGFSQRISVQHPLNVEQVQLPLASVDRLNCRWLQPTDFGAAPLYAGFSPCIRACADHNYTVPDGTKKAIPIIKPAIAALIHTSPATTSSISLRVPSTGSPPPSYSNEIKPL